MPVQIQIRRGSASAWSATNPILADGELALESDTRLYKVGDGINQWNLLPYGGSQGIQGLSGIRPDEFVENVNAVYPTGGPNNPQGYLNYYFPSALAGDSVVDLQTADLWIKDTGGDWNNLGSVTGVQGIQGLKGNSIQGTQGVQGIQGFRGSQGIQGVQGTQGIQGVQGTQGTQGIQGGRGFQGIQGGRGVQGSIGIQGFYGVQGFRGFQGTQGIQGISGTAGNVGSQGVQGFRGFQGIQGVQGLQGVQGSRGIQGLQGVQGAQGVQGFRGIQGAQGIQGIDGEDGVGTQGTQGLQGLQGRLGLQGLQGSRGLQGLQGNQGLKGDAVAIQTFSGSWNNQNDNRYDNILYQNTTPSVLWISATMEINRDYTLPNGNGYKYINLDNQLQELTDADIAGSYSVATVYDDANRTNPVIVAVIRDNGTARADRLLLTTQFFVPSGKYYDIKVYSFYSQVWGVDLITLSRATSIPTFASGLVDLSFSAQGKKVVFTNTWSEFELTGEEGDYMGPQGTQGIQGIQGIQGRGFQGIQGLRGEVGAATPVTSLNQAYNSASPYYPMFVTSFGTVTNLLYPTDLVNITAGSLNISSSINVKVGGSTFSIEGNPPSHTCRAYASFSGVNSITTFRTKNVSSVSRLSEGVYQINFNTAFPTNDYSVAATSGTNSSTGDVFSVCVRDKAVNSVTIRVTKVVVSGTGGVVTQVSDNSLVYVSIFY